MSMKQHKTQKKIIIPIQGENPNQTKQKGNEMEQKSPNQLWFYKSLSLSFVGSSPDLPIR